MKAAANLSDTLILEVKHLSGNQENITLSVEGLPDNVSYEFSNATGIPTFSTIFIVSAKHAAPGAYSINIVVTTASGKKNNFPCNLTLEESFDCASIVAGYFSGSSDCSFSSSFNIYKNGGVVDGLTIDGIDGNALGASIDCNTNEITIHEQTVIDGPGWKSVYTGKGKFTPPSILTLSVKRERYQNETLLETKNCTYTVTK